MVEFSDYIPVNLISLGILGALGLRRLVRMENHHWLRVVILTGFLWALIIYLFSLAYLPPDYCAPTPGVYCVYPRDLM